MTSCRRVLRRTGKRVPRRRICPDSTRLILTRFEGEILIPVDTAHATNGRFSFRYPATGKGRLAILTFSDDVSDMFLPLWSAPERKPSSRETTTASAHGA